MGETEDLSPAGLWHMDALKGHYFQWEDLASKLRKPRLAPVKTIDLLSIKGQCAAEQLEDTLNTWQTRDARSNANYLKSFKLKDQRSSLPLNFCSLLPLLPLKGGGSPQLVRRAII